MKDGQSMRSFSPRPNSSLTHQLICADWRAEFDRGRVEAIRGGFVGKLRPKLIDAATAESTTNPARRRRWR